MKTALVRRRFEKRLPSFLPTFRRVKELGGQKLVDPAYGARLTETLWGYLVLRTEGSKEEFGLQVAVVVGENQSPEYAHFREPNDSIEPPGSVFRLSALWPSHLDEWWLIRDEQFARITGGYDQITNGFAFSPAQCAQWISAHPELYADPLSGEERILYPHVDHMAVVGECVAPYFDSVARGTYRDEWPRKERPAVLDFSNARH